ncbi:MAG: hypothetical protein VR69_05245 [Peptococcaceae bacterium BRH_c4b]|nr:MAG: hypothetical protein VR69_05245 [Peptococcaceae bacterium BRH_c4b]
MFQLERKQQLVLIILAALILFGSGYKYAQWHIRSNRADEGTVIESPGREAENIGSKEIVVHVQGAVEKPGIYRLLPGARVADAVEKAVALQEADLDSLNLAEVLKDGRKIPVPYKQNPNGPATAAGVATTSHPMAGGSVVRSGAGTGTGTGGMVNINTAGLAELDTLPGIGPSLAQRIISYREENGTFTDPEDIKKISGIGDKKYEQLKDFITVN